MATCDTTHYLMFEVKFSGNVVRDVREGLETKVLHVYLIGRKSLKYWLCSLPWSLRYLPLQRSRSMIITEHKYSTIYKEHCMANIFSKAHYVSYFKYFEKKSKLNQRLVLSCSKLFLNKVSSESYTVSLNVCVYSK